jgi:hypothetical protein
VKKKPAKKEPVATNKEKAFIKQCVKEYLCEHGYDRDMAHLRRLLSAIEEKGGNSSGLGMMFGSDDSANPFS